MMVSVGEMARSIEHTLLKPAATPEQIDVLCDEVVEHGLGAVCVNPVYVRRAAGRLSSVCAGKVSPRVVSVAGFPLGASTTRTKVEEAREALEDGAAEIDMVVALGALKSGEVDTVRRDIEAVAGVVHQLSVPGILKVILETAAMTDDEIRLGCRLCREGGADFVKTSTGFHPAGGATVEHVRMLSEWAGPLKVKAAGGIRTAAAACAMIQAGAARIGTSAGVAILRELGRSVS